MSSQGQKVTYGRNAPETGEKPGPIASDSLAAESKREGAAFSSNINSEPLGVSGSNSTFANTNTSGAQKLNPASDANQRIQQEDRAKDSRSGPPGVSYPTSMGGQDQDVAVENINFQLDDGSYKTGSAGGGGSTAASNTAPSYVNSQWANNSANPKGKNLKEGGFDSNPKNHASFNSEIGSKDDPGRLAELKMQKEAMETAGQRSVPGKKGVPDDGNYGVLGSDIQA
ncbi:uncharacterized protein BP5553_03561 [Venustampulla echinocandica]|uniref:Uncharacterized protein n=1 Tax=Venustampulla echinocandica TaxID=2656787 RepID=A0A370TUL4_9HELO|nr:uncharacterized protein BP5553_03561 [Venustampulla echinocandica]RDL39221.1 hypothetical protein BP5553_03561 [Venustampulla echinocandica]